MNLITRKDIKTGEITSYTQYQLDYALAQFRSDFPKRNAQQAKSDLFECVSAAGCPRNDKVFWGHALASEFLPTTN